MPSTTSPIQTYPQSSSISKVTTRLIGSLNMKLFALTTKDIAALFLSPHHFLSGPEDTHLAEAYVERRALQGSIRLSHYNDVNAAREGGGIEASVQLFDLDEHLARQLAHVVHGLAGLVEGTVRWTKEGQKKLFSIRIAYSTYQKVHLNHRLMTAKFHNAGCDHASTSVNLQRGRCL